MDSRFSSVKVCVWDLDGTLYAPNAAFNQQIIEADYTLVMKHTGWSKEKTISEFHKIYKVETPSSTETAAKLSGITVSQAAIECELYKDRKTILKRDEKLISLFASLSGFTHYMLANGIKEKVIEAVSVMGVDSSVFAEIVTAETVGVNKPQPDGFQYIIKKTGLSPDAHLMVGDREAVDIAPAHALGMKTCLVWTDSPSTSADISLPSVYQVSSLLI